MGGKTEKDRKIGTAKVGEREKERRCKVFPLLIKNWIAYKVIKKGQLGKRY